MPQLYEKLIVWKQSYGLCLSIYEATKSFPEHEKFGLTSQMRRASSSVPINIAEGNPKQSMRDKRRFFEIALGSLNELHCECLLAKDLGYLSEERSSNLIIEIGKTSYLLRKMIVALDKFIAS